MKLLAVVAAALLLSGPALAASGNKISFRELFSMPLKFEQVGTRYYEQVTMVFGASKSSTSTGTSIKMIPDLAYNAITIGSLSDLNWGIDCSDANSCSVKAGTEHTCSRLGFSASCVNVDTFLRFRNQSLPSTTAKLTVEMMTAQDLWQPKGQGVLGLGPKSPLWAYMKSEYDTQNNYIDFSLFYRANELDVLISLSNGNFKNAVFVANGKGIAVDPFFINMSTPGNADSWILDSVNFTKMIDGKFIETAEKVCLANGINSTIATNNYNQLKSSVFTQLCGNAAGCSKANSDLAKVPQWTFKLYNKTDQDSFMDIVLKNDELINFDSSGNALLLVDDLNNYPQICQGATLAFGKFFLSAREVVVRFNKDSGVFLIGFHSFEPSLLFLVILLALASLIFIIFVGVCISSIVAKVKAYIKDQQEGSAVIKEEAAITKENMQKKLITKPEGELEAQ